MTVAQPGRIPYGVLSGEHAAPGLTEENVVLCDVELVQEIFQLIHKQLYIPKANGLIGGEMSSRRFLAGRSE